MVSQALRWPRGEGSERGGEGKKEGSEVPAPHPAGPFKPQYSLRLLLWARQDAECHEETYVLTGVSSSCVQNSLRGGKGSRRGDHPDAAAVIQDWGVGGCGRHDKKGGIRATWDVGCGAGGIAARPDVECEEEKDQG